MEKVKQCVLVKLIIVLMCKDQSPVHGCDVGVNPCTCLHARGLRTFFQILSCSHVITWKGNATSFLSLALRKPLEG